MNLHIVPDSKYINTFCANLKELDILQNNKIIIRSNKKPSYISPDLPWAPLYSSRFKELADDTKDYDKVFIHLFSPLMYRWVAGHSFKELNWMVWGADLYNLPFIRENFYETITAKNLSESSSINEWLYLLKVWVTNMPYKTKAYSNVDHVLTWMNSEYTFARTKIPGLRADQRFFFYENPLPYQKLDAVELSGHQPEHDNPSIIVGNSGYPTNNHLDAVEYLTKNRIEANLYFPVSYGDLKYVKFLKKKLASYPLGKVEFIDRYMSFDEYLEFLKSADALFMNNIRPQGYGNVLMMLYLGKPVFLNKKNISLSDLEQNGILTNDWSDMNSILRLDKDIDNKESIINLLSHNRLLEVYRELFS
jgi:hypothetical protein